MKSKHFFFVMIGIIIVGFAGIIGAFFWGDTELTKKAETLAVLKAEQDAHEERLLALSKTEKGLDTIEETKQLIDGLLPNEKNQEQLIADIIYTATAEAGIPVESIGNFSFSGGGDPSPESGTEQEKDFPNVRSYPFNISIENISYATLLKLLDEIESNGRLVQVATIQISPDKANPGQLSNVSLSLKAFLMP
jgi:Tfp pilus assembly protein PilO